MIEKALKGNRSYWIWIALLLSVIVLSLFAYSGQRWLGLTVTGMGRDISWGLYNAHFAFCAGVSASAVLVLAGYFRNQQVFAKTVLIGHLMAESATLASLLFIVADLGRPERILNMILYPSPHSLFFWDFLVLLCYFAINLLIGWATMGAERKGMPPPAWVKPAIYISLVLAAIFLLVTAFFYAGLHGRPFWLAVLSVPRFLASALVSATALLILVTFIMKRTMGFDTGAESQQKLAVLTSYAGFGTLVLLAVEALAVFSSALPVYRENIQYLYFGLAGNYQLVGWMWFSLIAGVASFTVMLLPVLRKSTGLLVAASVGAVLSVWIDRNAGLITGGFVPAPLGNIAAYWPSSTEIIITLGLWSIALLLFTLLLKVFVTVKAEHES
ncbi:MAG: polysulfide reductase NrfD [Chlorobium sp.]|nr:polysulfide reductase NrfD [Chlorobium sp.]